MSFESHKERTKRLSADEARELLAQALDALDWQEMAEADPDTGQRKGYFDSARELRRQVLRKARRATA